MSIPDDWLFQRVVLFIPLLLSLTVHEWAHAWSAWLFGDNTAKLQGRLSLDPLVHMDPIGTFIVPLLAGGFGWAKPVPIEPLRFRKGVNMSWGLMMCAAAGPISNVCLAVACVGLIVLFGSIHILPPALEDAVLTGLEMFVFVNVILAAFNMLPIPPLDGSRIAEHFMPKSLRPSWERVQQAGPILLIAVVVLLVFGGSTVLLRIFGAVKSIRIWVSGDAEMLAILPV
ncbi:MAG: site-2 protease family protein [Gemmataceae bacterium]